MKIRIISEKKVSPTPMQFPLQNPDFLKIQQPPTNVARANDKMLSVFMHYKAYQKIWEHVQIDFNNEVGGAVLGYYGTDKGNEFIIITDVLNQPPEYYSSPTLLRFTSQFYDDLEEYVDQIEKRHPKILRLGLYHTHPNYGVFLSKTDAKTFKGVFKDPFQIAMVVDPVRKEDGVFFWIGSNLSRRAGYRVYQTRNAKYVLHHTTTRNPLAAKYNAHLQLDTKNQIVPKIQEYEELKDLPKPTQKITIDKSGRGDALQRVTVEKERHRINKPLYIPRACPLYDMHYRNREVRLYRYFMPLQKSPNLEAFPFKIFIHRDIVAQLLGALEKKESVLGLLRGNLHFYKLQNLFFVDAHQAVIAESNSAALQPFNAIAENIAETRKNGVHDVLGWFFASQKPYQEVFRFTNMHQKIFRKNHHFGIVVRTKTTHTDKDEAPETSLDIENAYIVAYNYDKNIPFDYYRNLFLYEKPY